MLLPRNRWADSGPIKGCIARLLYGATRVPTATAICAAFAAITLLAVADAMLGPRWSLSMFYYLPIAFAAWRLGGAFGILASVLGALAWALIALGGPSIEADPGPAFWAFASRAVSFSVGALIVAEMRRLFERERGLARHDDLTGALSGRAFRDVLDAEVAAARRKRRSLALVYTDLDDFKHVNDCKGHSAGDAMLRVFAAGATGAMTAGDTLARTGGDEFVMLLVGHEGDERAAVERLRAGVATALGTGVHPISCTMGAIIVPAGHAIEPGELVRRADAAMYEAKRMGKGGLCVFELGQRSPLAVAA